MLLTNYEYKAELCIYIHVEKQKTNHNEPQNHLLIKADNLIS